MLATNNVDNIMATCSACGKDGIKESMNICNKCKMVHYCNLACKKKHKSKHKKKCEKHAAKLHDEALLQEPPPREECPICFLLLPLDPGDSKLQSCCGKIVCDGCTFAMIKEGVGKGKTKEEDHLCPYCRTPPPSSDEEYIQQMKKLMENGNAYAFNMLGLCFVRGSNGMPRDEAKANELFLKAGELGCADGYVNLGNAYYYGEGVEIDKKKANHFYALAAMNGSIFARMSLGNIEVQTGNYERAKKHFIVAARAGDSKCLEVIKKSFTFGLVTKNEYESTIRAYHESQMEIKSDARDKAAVIMAHGPTAAR